MCDIKNIGVKITQAQHVGASSTEANVKISYKNAQSQSGNHTICVGPSGCDQDRIQRTKDTDNLWSKIKVEEFINGLFRPSLLFIREALSCYQNGAFLGVAVICRSAVDSLLFMALNAKLDTSTCKIEVNFTGNKASFESLRKDAETQGFLDQHHIKWLREDMDSNDPEVGIIRHSGDLVAHYTEKIIKSQFAASTNQTGKSSQLQESEWIGKETSRDILEKTIQIITHVNEKYKKSMISID